MEIKEYEVVRTQEDSINLNDSDVKYTFAFEKGTFEDGTEITAFSYVAGGENRPVLFLTNGGPGSGVVWLHIGFCAPKRIHMDDDLHPQMCPPFYLEDNPNTLIDVADLVFIDPPGAGYSSINEEHKKDYASVDGDACAVARFIERWRIEHNATNRPTYFMGESYGTVRGPALLDALMGGSLASTGRLVGISLDGIILLGSVVSKTPFDKWQDQPVEQSVLNLECCAAAYAFHTGKDVKQYAKEALDFAPDYHRALFVGNNLQKEEKETIATKLHHLIGIDKNKLLNHHLLYTMHEFLNEVIPGKSIGYYDGRYLMDGPGKAQDTPYPGCIDVLSEDPAMGQYSTMFIQGMELLRERYDLPKKPYPLINCVINKEWNRHGAHTTLASLENAQRRNREMRILFVNGLLDMCTVPGGVHYVVSQSDLDLNRVDIKEYCSGHMAYFGEENASEMSKDIRKFIGK